MYFAYGFPKGFRLGALPFDGAAVVSLLGLLRSSQLESTVSENDAQVIDENKNEKPPSLTIDSYNESNVAHKGIEEERMDASSQQRERIVFICADHSEYIVVVTALRIQIWSAGKDRVKLGQYCRSLESIRNEGSIVGAVWNSEKRLIAAVTENGYMLFYGMRVLKESMIGVGDHDGLRKISLYLQNSAVIPKTLMYFVDGESDRYSQDLSPCHPISDICCDPNCILVALRCGVMLGFSWLGQLQLKAAPLIPVFIPEWNSDQNEAMSCLEERINSGMLSYSIRKRMGVSKLHYVSNVKKLVLASSEGSVVVLSLSEDGLLAFPSVRSYQIVYQANIDHQLKAKSVCLHPSGRILAVGLSHGRVYVYNVKELVRRPTSSGSCILNSTGSIKLEDLKKLNPTRVFSLSEWGFSSAELGEPSVLEWSPDGQVLAVGHKHGGVVLWTLSGCRVMCTLRQPEACESDKLKAGLAVESNSDIFQIANQPFQSSRTNSDARKKIGVLEYPIQAISWSKTGYSLLMAEGGAMTYRKEALNPEFYELSFAHLPPRIHRAFEFPLTPDEHLPEKEYSTSLDLPKTKGSEIKSKENKIRNRASFTVSGGIIFDDEFFILQASDRILIVTKRIESIPTALSSGLLQMAEIDRNFNKSSVFNTYSLRLPQAYINSAFPLLHVSISPDRRDIAVAGSQGLAVCRPSQHKWRLFGDSLQEREIKVQFIEWLKNGIILVVAKMGNEALQRPPSSQSLLLGHGFNVTLGGSKGARVSFDGKRSAAIAMYPRDHLDSSSLLGKYKLLDVPCAVDVVDSHVALVFEPLDIYILRASYTLSSQKYSHASNKKPELGSMETFNARDVRSVSLNVVRKLSLVTMAGVPKDVTLLAPPKKFCRSRYTNDRKDGNKNDTNIDCSANQSYFPLKTVDCEEDNEAMPHHCVLLREEGQFSILDLQKGSELVISDEIETYWVPGCQATVPSFSSRAQAILNGGEFYQSTDRAIDSQALREGNNSPRKKEYSIEKGVAWLERRASDGAAAAAAAAEIEDVLEDLLHMEGAGLEKPWWTYGPRGMQLWFPSTLVDQVEELNYKLSANMDDGISTAKGIDPELEFDKEVYPIGVSLKEVSVIGMMHRNVRNTYSFTSSLDSLSFQPHPESQPVLPCLLRRLLEHGQAADAVELATRHSRNPQFSKSLEWLLFTALEKDHKIRSEFCQPEASNIASNQSSLGEESLLVRNQYNAGPTLIATMRLVQQFPSSSEIIVSVARKTDVALWPSLFAAAGPPTDVVEDLLSRKLLQTAACCLVIVETVEGRLRSQSLALRLVRGALDQRNYGLATDLLRFLVPPGEGDLSMWARKHSTQGSQYSSNGFTDTCKKGSPCLEIQDNNSQNNGFLSSIWAYFSGEDKISKSNEIAREINMNDTENTSVMKNSMESEYGSTRNDWADPGSQVTAALHKAVSSASFKQVLPSRMQNDDENILKSPHNIEVAQDIPESGVVAWYMMGVHAWKLLESGALKDLSLFCQKMDGLHGGMSALLSTTSDGVPRYFPNDLMTEKMENTNELRKEPDAPSVASSLFVISNEFSSLLDGDVDAFVAAKELCLSLKQAKCINHSIALSLFLGDASEMEYFSAEYPDVWPELVKLVSNDVHLCAFTGIVSPPGTPLMQG